MLKLFWVEIGHGAWEGHSAAVVSAETAQEAARLAMAGWEPEDDEVKRVIEIKAPTQVGVVVECYDKQPSEDFS